MDDTPRRVAAENISHHQTSPDQYGYFHMTIHDHMRSVRPTRRVGDAQPTAVRGGASRHRPGPISREVYFLTRKTFFTIGPRPTEFFAWTYTTFLPLRSLLRLTFSDLFDALTFLT